MAEIIKFLQHQLDVAKAKTDDDIKRSELSPLELSKFFNIHKTCKEVKDLIVEKPPSSEEWVREKLYYLNNIMAEWQVKMHHYPTPGAIRSAMNLYQSLKQIEKDLQGHKERSVKDDKESRFEKALQNYRWSSPSVDQQKIHGFGDKFMIMERLLVRQETKKGFRAIGIVGIAGVGKTALCKVAFSNQEVKKEFLPRIWVCLSKQPNDTDYKREVVKRILMCLGLEDVIIDKLNQEGGLQKLLFALQRQLKGKKYLIVLDDVWNLDEGVQKFCSLSTRDEDIKTDQLAHGLPKEHGGTVIATSRSREIAENMVGEKNLHTLLPLADKTSIWKIFRDAVERGGDMAGKSKDENHWNTLRNAVEEGKVTKKEREMLKDSINCAKLPLIAKMKGQILRENLLAPREENQNRNQTQQETHQPGA